MTVDAVACASIVLRYKFSGPNLISPLIKIHIQAHNYFEPTQIFPKYFPHITQIFPKLYHLYKKPKLICLVGKIQKAQQNSLYKARCYMALLKPVATQHPKPRCYMALLQSPLLHDTLTKSVATRQYFYKISNYLQKPKYYIGPYLQKPKYYFDTYL